MTSSFFSKETDKLDLDSDDNGRWDRQHTDENWGRLLLAAVYECRREIAAIDVGFREKLYKNLTDVYDIAGRFNDKRPAWKLFVEDPCWGHCKVKKPTATDDHAAILMWVTRFVFGAFDTTTAAYNRSYKYGRTLQGFARDQIPVEEVADKLASDGVEYAFYIESQEHPRQAIGTSSGDEARDGGGSPQAEDGGDGRAHTNQPKRHLSKPARNAPSRNQRQEEADGDEPRRPARVARLSPTGDQILEVEVLSESLLHQILGLKRGQKARLTVEHRGADDGWQRVVLTRLKLLEERM